MRNPTFWIVSGPNGAGKTTLVQKGPLSVMVDGVEFLNPDDLTLELLRQRGYSQWADVPAELLKTVFIEGAEEVLRRAEMALQQGQSVGVETVLSTDKYRPLIESLPKIDGKFGLIYVALSSPEISRARVLRRVARGGHDVPADKLANRWKRSLQTLEWYLRAADEFWIFDNSSMDSQIIPPVLAYGLLGELVECDDEKLFPELRTVLAGLPRRTLPQ